MRNCGKWRRLFSWHSLTLGVVVACVGAGAFFLGRNGTLPQANAQQPAARTAAPAPEAVPQLSPAPPPSSAYMKGVVAYIYGTIPVTREELGEYLIGRFGAERLEPFVNKRIIEYHCAQQGIAVTAAEIEADLAQTLKSFGGTGVSKKVFEEQVLKARGKTLYEWKEDVIRPKLLMHKLCRERVRVEPEDLEKGFVAYYGDRVKVQMIVWPKDQEDIAKKLWGVIARDERAFEKAAREQPNVELARVAGRIEPFGRHTTGSPMIEKAAFEQLDIGDVSPLIQAEGQGFVVFKLLERIPPNKSVRLEEVREQLEKEIIEKKIQAEVPIVFAELRKQADPRLLLKKYDTQEQLERDAARELQSDAGLPREYLPRQADPRLKQGNIQEQLLEHKALQDMGGVPAPKYVPRTHP